MPTYRSCRATLFQHNMRNNFTNDGYAVVKLPTELVAMVEETRNSILSLANSFYSTHAPARACSSLAALREDLAAGLSQHDAYTLKLVQRILNRAPDSFAHIEKSFLYELTKRAQDLGVRAMPDRAIARFRIASSSQADHDHQWHQDSIDSLSQPIDQRNSSIGFWIPLHDVGAEEGVVEFALGSHLRPIAHTETDASSRLFFPEKCVQAFEKYIATVAFGDMIAIDSWVGHRTVANKSNRARIALLIWF